MSSKPDQDLDDLLARHLGERLDGQLGRSAAAFRKAEARRPARPGWGRLLLWGAGAALAAGVAIAWLIFSTPAATRHVAPPREVVIKDSEPSQVPLARSTTWTPVTEDGTAMVDDQPVRQLRRQIVDEVEWYDTRDNATIRRRMPREQLILIGVQTD
jgi:hypothetical protein